jgi:aquaporin Z
VNPARSAGVAVWAGGWALSQLWLFWVAPIVGAVLGSAVYRTIGAQGEQSRDVSSRARAA